MFECTYCFYLQISLTAVSSKIQDFRFKYFLSLWWHCIRLSITWKQFQETTSMFSQLFWCLYTWPSSMCLILLSKETAFSRTEKSLLLCISYWNTVIFFNTFLETIAFYRPCMGITPSQFNLHTLIVVHVWGRIQSIQGN